MPIQPDKDLAQALATKLGLTFGTQVRTGEPLPPSESPGVQLWVFGTGGPGVEFYMQRDAGDGHIVAGYPVELQVRVRATVGDAYDEPLALARSVVMAGAAVVLTMAGYDDVAALVSEPFYLGPNEGLAEWSVPYRVRWTQ